MKYIISKKESAKSIEDKLYSISNKYDDNLFLDFSLNSSEYRIVEKKENLFLLYITYPKLGFWGNYTNYKLIFYIKENNAVSQINGIVKLKTYTVLVLCLWSILCLYGFFDGIVHNQVIQVLKILFGFAFIGVLLFFEYRLFVKKANTFLESL